MDFPKKSCKKNCTFFAPIDPPIDRKAYTLCCNGLVIRKNQKQLKLVTIKKNIYPPTTTTTLYYKLVMK